MTSEIDGSDLESRREAIECIDYLPIEGSVRCQRFVPDGGCELPAYFHCVEWLKVNPDRAIAVASKRSDDAAGSPVVVGRSLQPAPVDRGSEAKPDLCLIAARAVIEPPKVGRQGGQLFDLRAHGATVAGRPGKPPLIDQPELLTEAQIDQLAGLGMEVELHTEHSGSIFLVPAYTGQERTEFTFHDCRTLVTLLQVFPGAKLDRIERRSQGGAS
jgi:hypothetical protein